MAATKWGKSMSLRGVCCWMAAWLLIFPLSLLGQGKPGGGGGTGGGGRTGSPPTAPPSRTGPPNSIPGPDFNLPSPTFLSGKVTIDDGTPLTDSAVIQTMCMGTLHNEGYTDSKGGFSFDLQSGNAGSEVQDADESMPTVAGTAGRTGPIGRRRDLRQCTLQADLPGFTSEKIELASKVNETGNADVGTIVLHRLAKVEGLTISATSAAAPGKARKEFQKGQEDEKKAKWDSAQPHFSKAVEIYPKYAVAWNELGRVELQKNDIESASKSFQQSINSDSKFVSPYGGLIQIALKARDWKAVADLTDKLLALNPVSFPQYWFDNSLANYFLESFDAAQKSAERGLSVDPQHQVPRLEYMLGMVLVKKRDYAGALTHVQNYLRLLPGAPDRETVEKQIAELQRLSTTSQLK